ncbi:MAG: TetR/AcrR family transcriptional regulator [Bacillota bacterium]
MESQALHRKETIIFTAIDVINEFGIQNVSTKEIAKRLCISEATIFKHYKTKNDLLLAVLDHYSQYDSDIFASSRERMENPLEALKFYVKAYIEYYENYPSITAITLAYDIMACDPELGDKIKGIFFKRTSFLRELVEAAKKADQFHPDTDTEKLADIILGSIRLICLKWRLNQYSFSLKEYTFSTLQMVLDAFGIK